jgi:hypothetical protein
MYGLIAMGKSHIYQETVSVPFLYDWRFWLFAVIEAFGMYTLNQNYINNPHNHTSINVGVFSTVLLTPILVYSLDTLLGFEDTIKIPIFDNMFNIILYISFYFIIGAIYFVPKIKNKEVNNPFLIVVTSLLLLFSFYVEVKLLQTYDFNFFLYTIMDLFFFLLYLLQSYKTEKGVEKKVTFNQIKNGIVYSAFGVLHLIGMTILATEIGVLARRVSQILAGMIADKTRQNKRDIILVLIMIGGGVVLAFMQT